MYVVNLNLGNVVGNNGRVRHSCLFKAIAL
jgi:hypothetical protein